MQAERYIAAADLGSSKIALSVAKIEGDDIQIIYYKETPSDGIRNSYVFNPKRAAGPLRNAIREAEEELNIKILQVVVGLPRYDVRQEIASARMERSDPSSVLLCESMSVGLFHCAIRFAIVNVLPEPVTPRSTRRSSPRFSPFSSAAIASG